VAPELRFEAFDRDRHDRGSFDCGVGPLNDYLKARLGQPSRKDVTRGDVLATPEGRIAGYFTLSAGRLMISVTPEGHGFPPRLPLPTTLIGRLAVDATFRGRGLGEALLIHAMRLAVETSKIVASALLEVDAKDEPVRAFYTRYGFSSLPDDPNHMYLPMDAAARAIAPPQP